MAKRYQKRPSEILNVEYDLLAFMLDEFSIFLELELTNSNGEVDWSKLNDNSKNTIKGNIDTNKDLMNHIEEFKKGPNVMKR